MNIVFMGTPDFAATCLNSLISGGHEISGVFSQPDRPKGRGQKLIPPPVKELALKHGIPVYQPDKMRDGTVLSILEKLTPELIVVVAYGRLLPREILEFPKHGCINVHASLLPHLRGAAPIQRAIINGDTETGITTMFMAEGLDTGDVIMREKTAIGENETAGELFERLAVLGADILLKTVSQIKAGTAPRIKQDEGAATYAHMIDKKLANINFDMEPRELCNLIRGLNPSPGAFSRLDGKIVKVLAAAPNLDYNGDAGKILEPKKLIVGCKNGAIELLSVRPEGKKPMSATDFARGKRLTGGEMFTHD